MTLGEWLVELLEGAGVQHVFGIPGVHTAELYRGLAQSTIRHITPRHEQGAGFMADGYARMTGRPGVCFVITGPGVTNIATAMGQAYQDSIPMLVISGVNAVAQIGTGNGYLHELPDQQKLVSGIAAFSHTLLSPEDLPSVLARAFAVFHSARPRPVHIEIPIDLMNAEVATPTGREVEPPSAPRALDEASLEEAARVLAGAQRPLILAGGGARAARGELVGLAERLDAPVVMTVNARGLLPLGHPLAVPASPSLQAVRACITEADVVLAVGTEIGPTDYDMYAVGGFAIPGQLIRVEIDPAQMRRNRVPELSLLGDAAAVLEKIAGRLGLTGPSRQGGARAARARREAREEIGPAMRQQVEFLNTIRDTLPGVALVGDSTQAVYAGNLFFEAGSPGGWFNSATGFGALGYALPASIGAQLGDPGRPVVCISGDGGLQFTLGELGSALDSRAPVIVLVWNNRGYREIKTYMQERGIEPEGVDLTPPDFCAVARAYGIRAERLQDRDSLPALLGEAAEAGGPVLIEIDEALIMDGAGEGS